jgi:hypothetical protein
VVLGEERATTMNPQTLLVVLPYFKDDSPMVRKLLNWIHTISPHLGPHCCLLAADAGVPQAVKIELGELAKSIFYYAETAIIPVPSDVTGWPAASNAMFRITAAHVQECFKLPWFWMEPDCTPIRPGWLDELAVSYSRCPKRFMGAVINSQQSGMPIAHLAGCAVYPSNASDALKEYTNGQQAWDIANAPYVIPRTLNTPLIHHHYGEMKLPPTFKAAREPGDPINTCTLDFVRKEAAVFHRCKDGTLIDVLSQMRESEPTTPAAEPVPNSEAPKRGPGRPRKSEPVLP